MANAVLDIWNTSTKQSSSFYSSGEIQTVNRPHSRLVSFKVGYIKKSNIERRKVNESKRNGKC